MIKISMTYSDVQHDANDLKMQLLYQEHYSRRENDIPRDAENIAVNNHYNAENTKGVIYNFL